MLTDLPAVICVVCRHVNKYNSEGGGMKHGTFALTLYKDPHNALSCGFGLYNEFTVHFIWD